MEISLILERRASFLNRYGTAERINLASEGTEKMRRKYIRVVDDLSGLDGALRGNDGVWVLIRVLLDNRVVFYVSYGGVCFN